MDDIEEGKRTVSGLPGDMIVSLRIFTSGSNFSDKMNMNISLND